MEQGWGDLEKGHMIFITKETSVPSFILIEIIIKIYSNIMILFY